MFDPQEEDSRPEEGQRPSSPGGHCLSQARANQDLMGQRLPPTSGSPSLPGSAETSKEFASEQPSSLTCPV